MMEKQFEILTSFEQQKKQFMLLANHELRTPVTIINTSLDVLMMEMNSTNPAQKKVFDIAMNATQRLNKILEKFLGIVDYEQKNNEIESTVINIFDLLHSLSSALTKSFCQRKISLRINCSKELEVHGSKESLYLVFESLLSNALKYTPDFGMINIQARIDYPFVVISIKDDGIGIPNNELNNIFKSFYQLGNINNHHSSEFEYLGCGAGLGLAYCKSVIDAHFGEIWATSEGKDCGSTFYVKLPLSKNKQTSNLIDNNII